MEESPAPQGRGRPGTRYCLFPELSSVPWLQAGVTTRDADPLRVLTSLGAPLRAVATARQVHGARVVVVGGAPPLHDGDPSEGESPAHWHFPPADALATSLEGVALMVSVADCLPVVLADTERCAVGVAHCGWRGLARGVLGALVRALGESFGSRAEDCLAALGPAIGPCCYEVGAEVEGALAETGRPASFRRESGRRYLDLTSSAERELAAQGVWASRVSSLRFCTACHPDLFHSHRRDGGARGRMWGFVVLTAVP